MGAIVGRWPGLAPENLYRGTDLAPTTDIRALVKAVLIDHLRIPANVVSRTVLPGSDAVAPLHGLIRT